MMLIYASLVALRICLAIFSYGYIHPDEYFQSGEPLMGDLYGLPTLKAWEFDLSFPCRSMASIRLANLPSVIYSLLTSAPPSPTTLFRIQRLTFLLWSFLLDLTLFKLSPRSLLPWSLSSSLLAFQIRPFSNSIESVSLALSLLLYSKRSSFLLGIVVAIGFFSRFTFAIFFLPIAVAFLLNRKRAIPAAAMGFVIVAAAHVLYDSAYYGEGWVVAPLNAFRYNVRTENTASHGVHPRWLHSLLNLPMMVGVATIASWPKITWNAMSKLCLAVILTSVLGLSISPHQEARFLLPLALPATLLASPTGSWLYLHALQHGVQTAVFGMTHQAGLIPAMLSLDSSVQGVAFCHTFMPPRHLLPPSIEVYDAGPHCDTYGSATLLLSPAWATLHLNLPIRASFGPHLDTDHLIETFSAIRHLGLSQGLAFNVHEL